MEKWKGLDTNMTKIIFVDSDKSSEKVVEADNGLSLLEVAHSNGIDLEGACEGCHAQLPYNRWKRIFENLPDPSEEEEDMLDLAWEFSLIPQD